MTAPDFSAMSDNELDEYSAKLMGWKPGRKGSQRYFDADGGLAAFTWYPHRDNNDSGKFSAAFMAAYAGWAVTINSFNVSDENGVIRVMWQGCIWSVIDGEEVSFDSNNANRARAETEATCAAWHAMKAGE